MPLSTTTERSQISRAEWLWLAGAVILGAILRLSFPGRMAIEHFDEGVYASNFWFDPEQGGEYPARNLYAPPLLPIVIEWTMIVASLCGIRPTGFIPMIPCLIAGIATIPSMWWVGRRWFGPTAGIVSAWLVASSDFHSSYSRAALTDVPVCLFILWGVHFIRLALVNGTRRDVLLASLFAGLAWWTKYNGWLPLAIGLAGESARQLTLPGAERRIAVFLTRWLLVAGLAFVFWCPVVIGLQEHGGYAAVAANHRQYIVGLNGWWTSAVRQLTHVGLYDNWLAVPNAMLIATPLLMFLVSIGCAIASVLRSGIAGVNGAGWFVLAWILGLSVATPFYLPYPRLILPWLIGVWLGFGMSFQMLANCGIPFCSADGGNSKWKAKWLEVSFGGWLIVCTSIRCQIGSTHGWQERSRLSRDTQTVAALIKEISDEAIVYVFGEPSVFFALKASGMPLVGPVQSLNFLANPHPRPTFFVFTHRAFRTTGFEAEWRAHFDEFEKVGEQGLAESLLVHLDQQPDFGKPPGDERLMVYRVR